MIVLCVAAFARAMASLPPGENVSHCRCHNDPNVLCLRDEDTIFLQSTDFGNRLLAGLFQWTSLIANPAVFSPDLKGTPPRSPFTGLLRCVQ